MEVNAKRFARRILLLHGLILLVVLAMVAGAAREIYHSARDQMLAQAQDRQKLLARQTASGIESHYLSIRNDMDLLRQAETDETGADKPTTQPQTPDTALIIPSLPASRPLRAGPLGGSPPGNGSGGGGGIGGGNGFRNGPGGPGPNLGARISRFRMPSISVTPNGANALLYSLVSRNPIVGTLMWKQLGGRVSLLYLRNHLNAKNPTDDIRAIGSDDARLQPDDINDRTRLWVQQLTEPSLSRFQQFNGVGANLMCVPLGRGDSHNPSLASDLVAVVPIGGIEKQFLQPLSEDPSSGGWLIDEAGTAMAASRRDLVGTTIDQIADLQLQNLARHCILNHTAGAQVMTHSFSIGDARFGPAMVTAQPVTIGNIRWELFVTTSLGDVDGLVAHLFDRALLWCIFVVVSVTAILVSTSVQMIRTRSRMERVRHEMLTRELDQARQIQLAWLPAEQTISDEMDISAINSPASHISGDFYNWFKLPDGRLVVTVGDVTGHGMAAAFLMATTQLLVRNTMVRLTDPGRCLEEVNRQLCVQVFNGQFVTMLVVILDPVSGRMEVATAGHPAPLVADGESFQPLKLEPQLVLGVDRDTPYATERYRLAPQASLLLYTDGVVECSNPRMLRFGTERLRRSLYGRYDSAKEMVNQVISAVNTFRGTRELDDDLTMVAVQLQPVAGAKPKVPKPV